MKELYVLLLTEMVTGKPANLRKFFAQEIFEAKRYLVEKKYLEGIVTGEEIIYSKITAKGREYLRELTKF